MLKMAIKKDGFLWFLFFINLKKVFTNVISSYQPLTSFSILLFLKSFFKYLACLIALPVLYLAAVILIGQFTYYQPKEVENLHAGESAATEIHDSTFNLLLWNIGFAGLGAESDFFYDGGEMVRSSKKLNSKYWKGIKSFLQTEMMSDSVDFILLQEVDINSKRSRHLNQVEELEKQGWHQNFAFNYKVHFVPLQFFDPLGKVQSGLLSLSKNIPATAKRYQFPGNYSWPNKLFFLRRCTLLQSYQFASSKKELIIINTHLSAYDDGSLKKQEMEKLKQIILAEYKKGNYVIVGADWNQVPSSKEIKQFLPDWTFAYDNSTPTNRSIEAPYSKESTTRVIDYYLVSPNVMVDSVKTINMDFAYSDHQPVKLTVSLAN